MDALMPLASAPVEIAGRNRIFRRMIIDSIRNDPDWKNGDYTEPPRGLIAAHYALFMMTCSPLQLHKSAPPRDRADIESSLPTVAISIGCSSSVPTSSEQIAS